MKLIRTSIVAAALLFGGVTANFAFADAETNVSLGGTEVGKPLAARGYDVVAYFTVGKPTVGTAEFTAVYKDAAYRFSSKENLDKFNAKPEAYVPQFGGYCAFGCFVGKKFDGDPTLWKIVDGKLYFNLNPAIAAKWAEETDKKISVANDKWKEIEHKRPEDIK